MADDEFPGDDADDEKDWRVGDPCLECGERLDPHPDEDFETVMCRRCGWSPLRLGDDNDG